jgi:hypothetical protein
MCLTCVQSPNKIIAEMGKKKIGFVTYSERVTLVTLCVAVNETGNFLTPYLRSQEKEFRDYFPRG